MTVKDSGRSELAEFVADHLFRDQHRDVLLPVINSERKTDELRQDGRASAPNPDHFVPPRRPRHFRLLQQIAVDERTLPNRTRHDCRPYLSLVPRVAARDDEFGRGFVPACLPSLGRESPRGHPVSTARGSALAAAVWVINRVHRHATIVWHTPHPTLAPGLADRHVHAVGIRHRADRRHTAAMYQP